MPVLRQRQRSPVWDQIEGTEGGLLCFLHVSGRPRELCKRPRLCWQPCREGRGLGSPDSTSPSSLFHLGRRQNKRLSSKEAQMESVQLKKAPAAEAAQKAQPPRFESIPSAFLRLCLATAERAGCTISCTRRCGQTGTVLSRLVCIHYRQSG